MGIELFDEDPDKDDFLGRYCLFLATLHVSTFDLVDRVLLFLLCFFFSVVINLAELQKEQKVDEVTTDS